MATRIWTGASSTAWGTAGNWSPTTTPVNGDDVIFDQNATRSVAGSDQSAVALASLKITLPFGDASTILFGDSGTPLKISIASGGLVEIGAPSNSPVAASGSGRINLDTASSNCIVNVYGSLGSTADSGKEPVRLRMNHSSSIVNVMGGTVGIATDNDTDTATVGTINAKGGQVNLSSGVTVTNVTGNGGTVTTHGAVTTLENLSSNVTTYGTALVGTLTQVGGTTTCIHRVSGGVSITTLNLRGGILDLSQNGQAITITSLSIRGGVIQCFSDTQLTVTTPSLDFNGSRTQFTFTSN